MNRIIGLSLRFPVVVLALAGLTLLQGWRLIPTTPLDVFPEFAPPLVEIQTEAPGLAAMDVEALVTVPIENALHGIQSVRTVRSKSVLGLSSVVLILEEGAPLMGARQLVQERLLRVTPQLPSAARPPTILPPLSSLSRVMKIGLWSDTLDQIALTTLAKWTIRPRLLAVHGVANVAIWGERNRQIQVLVDPDRLRAHNVTLDEVVLAACDATAVTGGGFLDTPNQRLAVAHVPFVTGPDDLRRIVVTHRNGAALRVGDVADVAEGFAAPIGDAVVNNRPGLLLIVEKQLGANTLEVTRQVETALTALAPGLHGVQIDRASSVPRRSSRCRCTTSTSRCSSAACSW